VPEGGRTDVSRGAAGTAGRAAGLAGGRTWATAAPGNAAASTSAGRADAAGRRPRRA
jgi:hypothetical protein